MSRTVATRSIWPGRFTITSEHICSEVTPQSSLTASASTRNCDEMMAVNDGAWRDPVAACRDPATNELGSFPWQKWDTGRQSSEVDSLSPSHPELLTNAFEIQLKGWGAGVTGDGRVAVAVAAALPLHLAAMSSGPGRKMKQSVSGVCFFFFFFSCLLQVHSDSDVICYSASRWSIWAPVESGWIITGGGKTMLQIKQNTYNGCGSDSVR